MIMQLKQNLSETEQIYCRTAVLDNLSLLDVPNKVATGCVYTVCIIKQCREPPLIRIQKTGQVTAAIRQSRGGFAA